MKGYLTAAEVAERAGVTIKTIYQHRQRGTMPEPDEIVSGRPLWRENGPIKRWLATPRRPGRPGRTAP